MNAVHLHNPALDTEQADALRELVAALDAWDARAQAEGNPALKWYGWREGQVAPGPRFRDGQGPMADEERIRAAWARVLAATEAGE